MIRIFYLTEKERRLHPESKRHEFIYREGHCGACIRWAEFLDSGRDRYGKEVLLYPLAQIPTDEKDLPLD